MPHTLPHTRQKYGHLPHTDIKLAACLIAGGFFVFIYKNIVGGYRAISVHLSTELTNPVSEPKNTGQIIKIIRPVAVHMDRLSVQQGNLVIFFDGCN